MLKKRTKVFYYEEITTYPKGTEFICVAGADLAGKIAVVADGFMEVVWKDTKETIENTIAYKVLPFVNTQL